jgi:hypothetical protein
MGGLHLGLGLALRLVAEGTCPSAAMVQARLEPLLPPGASAELSARARVEPIDELLRVEVRTDDGALLTVRDLARSASCADLADAAAVVIATALSSAPRAAISPLPPLEVPPPPPAPPPPPPPPPRLAWELSLAGALALGGARPTGGGVLAAALGPAGSRWALRLAAAATALRSEPVGDAAAGWTRAALFAGPRCRLWLGDPGDPKDPAGPRPEPARLLLDLQLGVGTALVAARGSGFVRDLTSFDWDVGLGAGAQLAIAARRAYVAPFLGAQLVGYLRPQELRVLGTSAAARLPALDVLLTAGLLVGTAAGGRSGRGRL